MKRYTDVTPEQVKQFIGDDDYQLVDVREPYEYSEGHVKGARNLPLGNLTNTVVTLDKSKKVVIICLSGGRSAAASKYVASLGYDTYNMLGGMSSWNFETER